MQHDNRLHTWDWTRAEHLLNLDFMYKSNINSFCVGVVYPSQKEEQTYSDSIIGLK